MQELNSFSKAVSNNQDTKSQEDYKMKNTESNAGSMSAFSNSSFSFKDEEEEEDKPYKMKNTEASANSMSAFSSLSFSFKDEEDKESVVFKDDTKQETTPLGQVEAAASNSYQPILEFNFDEPQKQPQSQQQQSVDREPHFQQQQQADPEPHFQQSSASSIVIKPAAFAKRSLDKMKITTLCKKFEKGTLVMAGRQEGNRVVPVLYALQLGKELMALQYLLPDLDVVVPSSIQGIPIKYIHPKFIHGLTGLISDVKLNNFKDSLSADNVLNFSKATVKNSFTGINSLKLPEGLLYIPEGLTQGSLSLQTIVIPSTVTAISTTAFYNSNIKDIYFNGPCPEGFKESYGMRGDVTVHYLPQYDKTFRG